LKRPTPRIRPRKDVLITSWRIKYSDSPSVYGGAVECGRFLVSGQRSTSKIGKKWRPILSVAKCSYPVYRVAQKSKPLRYDQRIVLNRIITCQWD